MLSSLLKNSIARRVVPSAAEAGTENRAFIAAVNRCATQKQAPPLLCPVVDGKDHDAVLTLSALELYGEGMTTWTMLEGPLSGRGVEATAVTK